MPEYDVPFAVTYSGSMRVKADNKELAAHQVENNALEELRDISDNTDVEVFHGEIKEVK